jgi:thymidylate synthase (FAD)
LGVAREDARYILPLACKTRITVSGNFQAWLDFCSLRTQNETQWELREIAQRIFNILCQEAPAFFEYFRDNGKCARKKFVKEGE